LTTSGQRSDRSQFFERFQQVVIELQAQFEDPIGKTLLMLKERQGRVTMAS